MMIFKKIPSCKDLYHHKHKIQSGDKRSLREILLMKVHLFLCKNCQRLEDGLDFIQTKMTESVKRKIQNIDEVKVNELKEKIKSKLK